MTDQGLLDIDPSLFRRVLGHFPTGVTVIATVHDGRPVGCTVGSFFSVSLDPPLVGFCVMTTSSTWPAIQRTGRFGVSVLADEQIEACRQLATKAPDKFDALAWSPAPTTGSPLLAGAVAHLDCVLEQTHLAGDHWIALGRVVDLALHREEADPLVFCRGAYGRYQSTEY
jgi:3-hydroxy-9,10-secoandrosta-1,3,5(10)-triene-9,17-dione monooxygenase reductase component